METIAEDIPVPMQLQVTLEKDNMNQSDSSAKDNIDKMEPSGVVYDFACIPKSMYLTAPKDFTSTVEPLRPPTSVNDMMNLKKATRERLRQQRYRKLRDKARNDLFTNPEKYIPSTECTNETTEEEIMFLESFRSAARKTHHADDNVKDTCVMRTESSSPSPKSSRGKCYHERSTSPSLRTGNSYNSMTSKENNNILTNNHIPVSPSAGNKKKKKKKFIPPEPRQLPPVTKPNSPPKSRPEVFKFPPQKIPSPRELASSPRLLAAMTLFQNKTDEFGYSSMSDTDGDDADPEHIELVKELDKEKRRRKREEAEYRYYIKHMEGLTSDQVACSTKS